MGAGVAFQQPVILRSTMQAPRAPSGAPTKPAPAPKVAIKPPTVVSITQVPKILGPSVHPFVGTRTQTPTPTSPGNPGAPPIPQPHFLTPGQQLTTDGPISAPLQGPGITDTTGAPPAPPPSVTVDNSGGGGGGPVSAAPAAQPFPWLAILAIAGGLYLVTR
jgi:hypothetical protein